MPVTCASPPALPGRVLVRFADGRGVRDIKISGPIKADFARSGGICRKPVKPNRGYLIYSGCGTPTRQPEIILFPVRIHLIRAYGLLSNRPRGFHNMRMNATHPGPFPSLDFHGSASKFVNEIYDLIDHVALFEDLKHSEVESLCGFMDCFGAPRDTTLFTDGQEGDFLLVILTGKIQVVKHAKIIATVGPGATLGEMSMIDGEPRFATCITLEPTDFAIFTRQALIDVMLNMPRLGNKLLLVLLQMMTRRLRDTSNNLLPHIAMIHV